MTHGNGESAKRFINKPLVIPIALAITITGSAIGIAYGYGQVTRDVEATAARVDRIEQRVVKELDQINGRLDELIRFLRPSKWDQR
ncbi:hypothetical protein LCGC14_0896010 [marine sediment metagenome]|uniref:Uncharacterized protein n=1 Tax=marine sediment metagenome TaxID=412755 RepID=A0A0F9PIQ0_9ZZZZ